MSVDFVVGIDLGTTNSAIAYVNERGLPEMVPNAEGRRTTPSVVQIRADGSLLVGEDAKQEIVLEKENTAHFFKREMGSANAWEYRARRFTPVDLSAAVLAKLKRDAEAALRREVRHAVVTVPAYFQDAARLATREAAEKAGLAVVQIVNEPTAAAIAYGLNRKAKEELVLVYDLGGGTFDVTLVRIRADGIEVVGTDGNHNLGGKDWDDRLLNFVCEEFRSRHGIDPLDDAFAAQELLVRAEDLKKTLTSLGRSTMSVNSGGVMDRIEVTRAQFEDLTRDLLGQTEALLHRILAETRTPWDRVGSVLMVGGSTRMPMCHALVQRVSGRAPNTAVNPDECVALGAALQGSVHVERKPGASGLRLRRESIRDVMSHSMGMIAVNAEGDRYINSVLIPKNRPIPSSETRPFQVRTASGRAATTSVFVTQGECDDPAQCSFVGKYVVGGIPHASDGLAVVDIGYAYDSSGIVTVNAKERRSGVPLPVEKHPLPEDMSWVFGPPRAAGGHKTVLIAVDLSGSMSGQPLRQAQEAIEKFVAESDLSTTSIGLLPFADERTISLEPTQDAKKILQAAGSLRIGQVGGGNDTDPFDLIRDRLRDGRGAGFAVVLTDGRWGNQERAVRLAKACHEANIQIVAVGFGSADESFLRRIANTSESAIFSSDLSSAFRDIAQVLVETDGHGLSQALGQRWGR